MPATGVFSSPRQIMEAYAQKGYVLDEASASIVYVATRLEKPLLIEGPAGVGKTELAKATAAVLDLPLIRLQCYEGLDESKALYEWKYGKQLLYTQILREKLDQILQGADTLDQALRRIQDQGDLFFSEGFLEPRPILQALQAPDGAVLLVDEVDKADEEFEAFLLEVLSDFQVSIPELGTLKARRRPFVFLTSNATREIGEALRRRCLYLHLPFPDPEREMEILRLHVPDVSEALGRQVVAFVKKLRGDDLRKVPSVSETIDWARALVLLNASHLDREIVRQTLSILLKHHEDLDRAREDLRYGSPV
ncbi:MoxR-like ATPase [Desulfacinum infernum DSM 9756]|uniref:MoxR-like ATPase n=1 Tax=Desulfacinum infernum DSM 9756 TaxID=1121391 RepID=A0A1M5BEW9_9BACT|nr:MoxR family ATPase [Desulfacinum infernum]SHF40945.1 MoxR-like ATPase [Desulfacinum infernum DSM 9756]